MTKPISPSDQAPRDEAAFKAAVAQGVEEADAGLATPFEDVAAWLATWGDDDEAPPPR